MQIVIDIDNNLYTRLFDNGKIDAADMLKVCAVVRKGIPLPQEYKWLIEHAGRDELGACYDNNMIINKLVELGTINACPVEELKAGDALFEVAKRIREMVENN